MPCSKLLDAIASGNSIDAAYHWLRKRRRHYGPNADIWHLSHQWAVYRKTIIAELHEGRYTFSPQQRIILADGRVIHLWNARDALVIKAMAIVLGRQFPISPRCTHVKGHGGLKGSLRWLGKKLPHHRFVFRSDVKGYYDHIDHRILIEQLQRYIHEQSVMRLLVQVIQRTVEWGGTFRTIRRGIGRGSSLSPLFAALYLKSLDDAMDQAMNQGGIAYVRYMDDWVVLTSSRWKLRRCIRRINQILGMLKLYPHPDKTWMGQIDRGFDFLGYHHTRARCSPAQDSITRFKAQLSRLYEQGASPRCIGGYRARWWRWVFAGLPMNQVLVKTNRALLPGLR